MSKAQPDDDQSQDGRPAATRPQWRRWLKPAATIGTTVIAGLIVAIFGKGLDALFRGSPPPASAPTSAVTPTASIPTTAATSGISIPVSSAPTGIEVPPGVTTTNNPNRRPPDGPAQGPPADDRPAPSQEPAPVDPPVLANGHATIVNVDGFDMDTGTKGYQDDAGMDVSPDNVVTRMYAMSHGTPRMAVLQTPGTPHYARCAELPEGSYVQDLQGIRSMHVGDHICVRTSQRNYGVITLTQVPSDVAEYVDFDFITWDAP